MVRRERSDPRTRRVWHYPAITPRPFAQSSVFVPEGTTLGSDDDHTALMRRLSTLTPQQVRVLMMLSDGLMNKQIAYELSISEATVKAHVSAILQKLDVDSRTQAVIAAARIEDGQFEALFSTGAEKA